MQHAHKIGERKGGEAMKHIHGCRYGHGYVTRQICKTNAMGAWDVCARAHTQAHSHRRAQAHMQKKSYLKL